MPSTFMDICKLVIVPEWATTPLDAPMAEIGLFCHVAGDDYGPFPPWGAQSSILFHASLDAEGGTLEERLEHVPDVIRSVFGVVSHLCDVRVSDDGRSADFRVVFHV